MLCKQGAGLNYEVEGVWSVDWISFFFFSNWCSSSDILLVEFALLIIAIDTCVMQDRPNETKIFRIFRLCLVFTAVRIYM